MKVLFVNNGLAGGGTEKLLNDLLPIMRHNGIEISLLILTDKDEKYLDSLKNNGISVDVVPPEIKGIVNKVRYIRKYVLDGKFDVVHAHSFPTFYYCSIAKQVSKCFPRLVVTEHNTDNRRRHYPLLFLLEKLIYRAYDSVISISDQTQNCLLDWLREKDNRKYKVIYNGIPLDSFVDAVPYSKKEISDTINHDDILICMVGRFFTQKNHDLAFEVIKQLPSKYKLILLGEGELKEKYRKLAADENISDRVVFMGFRSDVSSIVKTCDMVIIPSRWEGFGLIAVEAMACEIPVVVSNVPGLSNVVGDYGLIAELDANSFCEQILKLHDEEVYNKYKNRSYERAKMFDINLMANEYVSVYRNLSEGK